MIHLILKDITYQINLMNEVPNIIIFVILVSDIIQNRTMSIIFDKTK